jgi:hypothetical protein
MKTEIPLERVAWVASFLGIVAWVLYLIYFCATNKTTCFIP